MVRTESSFADLQAADEERLGLGELPLVGERGAEVVQAGGHVGMVGPEGLLEALEAAREELLGGGEIALVGVERGEVVEAGGHLRRVGARRALQEAEQKVEILLKKTATAEPAPFAAGEED